MAIDKVEKDCAADLIIYGNICTGDDENSNAEAMAIKDGKIFYIGDKARAEEYKNEATEILDYRDNYIISGSKEDVSNIVNAKREIRSLMVGQSANFIIIDKYNVPIKVFTNGKLICESIS
ncbi:MAG: hypothetical protein PUE01_00040 [Clostridiaceae bacterium]|nr:hypothetical protein [Clostridiaceae bacterium]